MTTIIQGIAQMEGCNVPNSRAARNLNPGNLNFAPWEESFGAVLETIPAGHTGPARFAAFPTLEQGEAALRHLLTKDYLGMTLEEGFNKYAPPSENQTNEYLAFICKACELQPTDLFTAENIG